MSYGRQEQDDAVRTISARISLAPGTPLDRVWAIVTDLRQMPGLHPHVLAAHWLDGATEASVGARFATENADADGTWHSTSRIIELLAPSTAAWTVESAGTPPAVCRFDVIGDANTLAVHQTYFVETRPGAGPPIDRALAFVPVISHRDRAVGQGGH